MNTVERYGEQLDSSNSGTEWDALKEVPFAGDQLERIDHATFNVMRDYHEVANQNKHELFESMARQEKIEREFNENLTSVDELEGYAESDDPRVVREIVQYHDKEIPVYRLRGYPMKFLSHMINYRENDKGWEKGRELSDQLMENPRLWNSYNPSDISVSKNGWTDESGGHANTLSTSYVDLVIGIDSFDHLPKVSNPAVPQGRVIYGISKVRPMSVLSAQHQDGRTSPQTVSNALYKGVGSIEQLNADNATNHMYNEVAMLRYDDHGNAVPVDFMVTDSESVLHSTEEMPEQDYYGRHTSAYYANAIKHHAAEHEVPIVLVEREYYPKTVEDYTQNLGKMLEVMSPEELFDKMPTESRGQILQGFLSGDNLGAWDYIQGGGAKDKLERLVSLTEDEGIKAIFSDFLTLNGY